MARLSARIGALAEAAKALGHGPFLPAIHVQPIDAASLEDDPATGLAARLHAGLRQAYPDLARELGHAARDPHIVLREVNEKLDDARRRLDSERRALDDAGSRRARLTETVLYEAAGSQVDAYARANRAGIENRLAGFGLRGDPIRTYKDLVQLVAGSGGALGLTLRSLWAFKGQTKLIIAAIVLAAIGIGLGIAVEQQAIWLADLRAGPQSGIATANWAEAHMAWLEHARSGAFVLAGLAIVANLWRAFGFMQPILKGARLLDGDLDSRKRDLDGLYAHQTKRVDALDVDVERLTRESAEAERRVGGDTADVPSPFATAGGPAQAQQFFGALTAMMAAPKGLAVPNRIVLALDHLDALAPERARMILDSLHRAGGAGLVTLVAVDPARLAAGGVPGAIERWVQVPVGLDVGAGARDYSRLVDGILGRNASVATDAKPDARQSVLDQPVDDDEAMLLSSLSGLAGPSPRAVKRFVDLYRLARLDGDHRGALALMLALALGGTEAEMTSVAAAIEAKATTAPFDLPQANPRLRAALDAVMATDGRFTVGDAAKAGRRAAVFSV